jgi:hypothetical protein
VLAAHRRNLSSFLFRSSRPSPPSLCLFCVLIFI